MGGLFSRNKVVWVPVNEKLQEKIEQYKQWDAKVSFVGWNVCNDGIALCKTIGKTNTVAELDLSFNGLGDKEVKELALAIKENAQKNPGPKDEGKLQELGTFKKINLSNNHIHFKRDWEMQGGICALTHILMDNSVRKPGFSEYSLRELNLANNYLGPGGAAEIGKVLKQNRYLLRVDLSWYALSSTWLRSKRFDSVHHVSLLFSHATRSCSVTKLASARNNIGSEGLVHILESLRSFHRAARINVRNNMFEPLAPGRLDGGWAGLKKALKKTIGPDNLDGDTRGGVILGWTETPLVHVKA
jgi:hypothetical protein